MNIVVPLSIRYEIAICSGVAAERTVQRSGLRGTNLTVLVCLLGLNTTL